MTELEKDRLEEKVSLFSMEIDEMLLGNMAMEREIEDRLKRFVLKVETSVLEGLIEHSEIERRKRLRYAREYLFECIEMLDMERMVGTIEKLQYYGLKYKAEEIWKLLDVLLRE